MADGTTLSDPRTLRARSERWIADDPDPDARAELRALLERDATDELAERFAHGLSFGTAGLRGPLGAGPARMNVATVRGASAGLARYVLDAVEGAADAGIVVGHDARHGSARFAAEAAAVFSGAGLRTRRLPPLAPTPLLAFAVRQLGCAAGVMVTASHNPPRDNGYKVYLGDGGDALGDEVAEAYLRAILGALPASEARALQIAYTPLHGVGAKLCLEAFARAGFTDPHVVAEQADPDPDFSTVQRPNPEEPGTLDLGLAEARRTGADVLLANDPDADRLAVAIPEGGDWRVLHGDEIGALLADFLLERAARPEQALLVTTIASSTLLARMAEASGARYAETLTGFKWIMRAVAAAPEHRLVLGYEEALGYAVFDGVRDKDGISAALVIAQLAAHERQAGRTLADRLEAIAARFGRHATAPIALELTGAGGRAAMRGIIARVRERPPAVLLGRPLTCVDDVATGVRRHADGREEPLELPRSDVLVLRAEGARVVIRPSGTEPKLKVYLEVVVDGDRRAAADALARLRAEVESVMVA